MRPLKGLKDRSFSKLSVHKGNARNDRATAFTLFERASPKGCGKKQDQSPNEPFSPFIWDIFHAKKVNVVALREMKIPLIFFQNFCYNIAQ